MTKTSRRGFAAVVASLIGIALSLLMATNASARVGDSTGVPGFYGIGSVSLTSYGFAGQYYLDYQGGPYCIYLQYKHVARLGVDATWNRLTGNSCGAPIRGGWSAPTDRPFNGIKFRICQDKPNALDPCGNDVTLYR